MIDEAHKYAKATTSTRCAHLGWCEVCTLKACDYRSRYDAFLDGWRAAYEHLCKIPFDKAFDELGQHAKRIAEADK